jgi:hemerythrin
MTLAWNTSLETGNREIDDQHLELFRRIDGLLEAMMRNDAAETGRLLEFLGDYVVDHFAAEDRHMLRSRYPDHAAHRAEHEAFIKEFVHLKSQWQTSGPLASLTILLSRWLGGWLRRHISESDRRLAAHLRARAAAPAFTAKVG